MAPPKKKKKEEEVEDEFTPMTGAQLMAELKLRREKVNDVRTKRNYIQQDRDMVEQFYQNTSREIEDVRTQILNKETEMEELETSHRVEVKVYLQRIKHLEYELERTDIEIEKDGNDAKGREKVYFQKRNDSMKEEKKMLKENYTKFEKTCIVESDKLEKEHRYHEDLNLKQYEANLHEIETKYQARYQKLIEDLELKLKVEVHELEERKNLHINELVRNHEEAFATLKAYYNDITSDNLRLIKEHKAEMKKLNEQASQTQLLIQSMSESNKKEKVPLEKLRARKEEKRQKLKYFQKEKNSLRNYKSKLHVLKEKKIKMVKDMKALDEQIEKFEQTRKTLELKFGKMSGEVKQHSDLANIVLSQKLSILSQKLAEKEDQLKRVIQHSSINPSLALEISQRVRASVEEKNAMIRNLQYSIHHATKAYNDAIRVYETKLVEFGIPEEELGFQPLQTPTSTMPAGLVSS